MTLFSWLSSKDKKRGLDSQGLWILKQLQKERAVLYIGVEAAKPVCQSEILGLSESAGQLLIQQPFPPQAFTQLARQADRDVPLTLQISARNQQNQFQFSCRLLQKADPKRSAYPLAFPDKIDTEPRREFYRAPIASSKPVKIHLNAPGIKLEASLANLSLGGLQARLDTPPEGFLEPGQTLDDCLLELEQNRQISCKLMVRGLENKSGARQQAWLRGEFLGLGKSELKVLEGFIASLQREARRKGVVSEYP